MKMKKEWFAAGIAAAAILLTGVAVLVLSRANIGIAGADLNIRSDFFNTSVSMDDIGIALMENGSTVSERTYNSEQMNGTWITSGEGTLFAGKDEQGNDLIPEKIILEQEYDEALSVSNTGTINEYVRLTIYKYWLDAEGNRLTELSPDLIRISLDDNASGAWQKDETAHTEERDVYYYTSLLTAGAETPALTKSISISNDVAKELQQKPKEGDPYTIITTYKYNGVQFVVEATADGVQENNAEEAIASAWGVNVSVDEDAGTLALR